MTQAQEVPILTKEKEKEQPSYFVFKYTEWRKSPFTLDNEHAVSTFKGFLRHPI